VRESDTVARLGGDEFTVLLYDLRERKTSAASLKRSSRRVSQPYELDGHEVHIGVSIGIARFSDDTEDEDSLVNLADRPCIQPRKKAVTPNRFCVS